MIWLKIRKREIGGEYRALFERLGVPVVQEIVATAYPAFLHGEGSADDLNPLDIAALKWLTEQYDRAERKETWSLTMEIAITVFVFGELVFSLLNYFSKHH